MWVKNNDKERVKSYLKSDVGSNITNVTDFRNRIHDLISAIDRATAGTPSGMEREMIDGCKKAVSHLSDALQNLNVCQNCIDQINTMEWVDDEQDRRDYQ